jgi:hypothetical protein
MFTDQHTSAHALGDRVRAASPYRGPWPKISIWHGTADTIVKPSNAEGSIRQWLDVHGLPSTPSYEEKIGGHLRRVWNDSDGNPAVEAFSISGMAHGVPLGLTLEGDNGGTAGPFFLEAGIWSTHHIAQFWALNDSVPATVHQTAHVPMRALEAAQDQGDAGGGLVARQHDGSTSAQDAAMDLDRRQAEPHPHDANATIADAFEAAGLPVPKFPAAASAATHVDPAPIIEAALKAAGLRP